MLSVIKEEMLKSVNSVMKDKGLSKTFVSRQYGCDVAYISRILSNKQQVSIDVLIDLLEICGCNVEVSVRY